MTANGMWAWMQQHVGLDPLQGVQHSCHTAMLIVTPISPPPTRMRR